MGPHGNAGRPPSWGKASGKAATGQKRRDRHSRRASRRRDCPLWCFVRLDDEPARRAALSMVGATDQGGGKLLTVTICADCYQRSPTFEDAGRAALEVAEAALLSDGRSFTHGVAAPERLQ